MNYGIVIIMKYSRKISPLIILLLLIPISACSESEGPALKEGPGGNIRPPVVAGGFYPANPSRLREMIRGFLDEADVEEPGGEVLALIVPHAGYVYSGRTAAYSFKLLEGLNVKTVFLVGCSHKAYFPGVSVFGDDGYRTPLGVVPVDKKLASWIRDRDKDFNYYPQGHSREHSLEVELPFLQQVLKGFHLVPILIGQADNRVIDKLGEVLARAMEKTPDSIIVCSTDMTHYPPEGDSCRIDQETLDAIKSMDREKEIGRAHV